MADALPKDALDTAVKPSEVAGRKFDLERRGFDQAQVRAYLIAVADSLRDAQGREAEIRTRLGKAIRRAERAESAGREHAPEDPSVLTRQLGDEVVGVLDAARVAGEQKIAAAEKSAEQLLANSKAEATKVRRAAETIMADRTAEADAVADAMLAERKTQADELVVTASKDADTLRSDAAADVARARDEGDALIREAEEARVQILQDMDRRRRESRAQVERLRVGRDRLLRSYEVVRRTLDESTGELKSSLTEAKVLGDSAARRIASEDAATPHQLEAEIADARLVGRGPGKPRSKGATAKPGDQKGRSGQPASTRQPASTGQPGTKTKTGATSGSVTKSSIRGGAPSAKVSQVPRVDMGPSGLAGEVAPTPRRPIVHQDTTMPRPPASAPTIKAPNDDGIADLTPGAAPLGVAGGTQATTATAVADPVAAVAVDLAQRAPGLDAERASVKAETTVNPEADLTPEAAEDFGDLLVEELSIIDPCDDIEQVRALVPETVEIDGTEIVNWVATDVAQITNSRAQPEADRTGKAEADSGEQDSAAEIGDAVPGTEACEDDAMAAVAEVAADDAVDEATEVAADDAVAEATEDDAVAEDDADEAVEDDAVDEATEPAPSSSLFAALRRQADEETASNHLFDRDAEAALAQAASVKAAAEAATDMARQRDAIIDELSSDIEKRLKRALADEQNDVFAGLRGAGRKQVDLIDLVGETDNHVNRYVRAINEVATSAYGAGAELVDRTALKGEMPAGAVEELIGSVVVLPLRLRLLELDALNVDDNSSVHIDALRAFYRQRKTDHLSDAATSLAALLVTAGACDVLHADEPLPWMAHPS